MLTVLVIAILFVNYLLQSPQIEFMDLSGTMFYIAAAISHAAMLALIPFALLFVPIVLISGKELTAGIVHIASMTFTSILCYLNGMVFSLYKFHINGIVLSMYFGEGSDEIFDFDTLLYVKMFLAVLLFAGLNIGLKFLADTIYKKFRKAFVLPSVITLAALFLFANLFHAYAAVANKQSVIKSATHLPYFFPLTANKLMLKLGVISQDDIMKADFKSGNNGLDYPKNKVRIDSAAQKKNIVIIAIDSWNCRTFCNEVMPNVMQFAERCEMFDNHLSSSNGTRGSIFGMFFGVSSYYWKDFEVSGVTPVFINTLLDEGYEVKTYPSATLNNPNFAKLIFRNVPNLNATTKGETVYERDCQITKEFIDFINSDSAKAKPFFSFLFYDLPHSYAYPKDRQKKFVPSWEFADYTKLNNDMDPEPFWNLYRNCAFAVDSLIGSVTKRLEENGLLENSVVIITGDHGQEFNENKKNYWGHGSNYTKHQIHVPLLYYTPGCSPKVLSHRTTHYDIAATLMHDGIGVTNDPQDYCMGRLLHDPTFRNWHIVGDNLNYAFIVENDVIVEKKPSGSLEIYDANLNPLEEYKINAKVLNNAILKMNEFYKTSSKN